MPVSSKSLNPHTESAFEKSLRPPIAGSGTMRTETDSIGSKEIPAGAYWGINVARAIENFPISGRPISIFPDFIYAYACVKQASARANAEIGVLDKAKADLIDRACEEIKAGKLMGEFVVDVIQGGAGTSTNMNVNEVIANRGLELAGHPRGAYKHLDPNDDVNKGQSTNDSYPTSLKIGLCIALQRFELELGRLEKAFRDKGREFKGVLKVGRTQLMDAVPMTLEQEFESFAVTLGEDHGHLDSIVANLCQINLGGTAIGTGIAADPRFPEASRKHLAAITGFDVRTAPNLIAATSDVGTFMELSGALKRTAMKLSKICNDLRLLGSGPQAGLAEIRLPARQAGSSIMPGKVNPVIPEVMNQIAFAVAGADVTISMAAEGGQLQLNAFEPIMAHSLFTMLGWMTAGCATLRVNCVDGIEANRERLAAQVGSFVGVITALIPHIGYGAAAKLAKKSLETHGNIADMVVAEGLMTREQVEALLSPEKLT